MGLKREGAVYNSDYSYRVKMYTLEYSQNLSQTTHVGQFYDRSDAVKVKEVLEKSSVFRTYPGAVKIKIRATDTVVKGKVLSFLAAKGFSLRVYGRVRAF